jgi:hypothetical protein
VSIWIPAKMRVRIEFCNRIGKCKGEKYVRVAGPGRSESPRGARRGGCLAREAAADGAQGLDGTEGRTDAWEGILVVVIDVFASCVISCITLDPADRLGGLVSIRGRSGNILGPCALDSEQRRQ